MSTDHDVAREVARTNFRGTVIAAVLGCIGVIVAASVGHSRGRAEAERTETVQDAQIDGLRKENAQLKDERKTLLARIAELSKGTPTPITGTDTIASGSDEGWRQPQRTEEYTFTLTGCQRKGETVNCQFSVTADERDRFIYLWGTSRLIEKEGTQRLASSLSLGGKTYRVDRHASINEDLVRGVAMSGTVSFEGVTTAQNVAAVIEIVSSGAKVQFRDVPLS